MKKRIWFWALLLLTVCPFYALAVHLHGWERPSIVFPVLFVTVWLMSLTSTFKSHDRDN